MRNVYSMLAFGCVLFLKGTAFGFDYGAPTATPDIRLRDCTPQEYFSKTLKPGSAGPMIFMPYLPIQTKSFAAISDMGKRPYLKIKLLSGRGHVVVMGTKYSGKEAFPTPTPNPDELKGLGKNEWISHPSFLYSTPFLFYPEGPADTTYHLQVTVPGSPERGTVDYEFTTAPLDKALFDQAKADIQVQAKTMRAVNYHCRMISKISNLDWQTHLMSTGKATTILDVYTSDSFKVTTQKDGKPEVKTMPRRPVSESDITYLGDPWGEDAQNLIFLRTTTNSQENVRKTETTTNTDYFFHFVDKVTHNTNQLVLFGDSGSASVDSSQYTKLGPGYIRTGSTNIYYKGDGEVMTKFTSVTDQIQIDP